MSCALVAFLTLSWGLWLFTLVTPAFYWFGAPATFMVFYTAAHCASQSVRRFSFVFVSGTGFREFFWCARGYARGRCGFGSECVRICEEGLCVRFRKEGLGVREEVLCGCDVSS